ncbi:hypothetical protein HY384_00040 [Candidatus Daviesbacteria bacterium]|nr:hypothetical protein [Candidatus Daviesbacteria bacterium]
MRKQLTLNIFNPRIATVAERKLFLIPIVHINDELGHVGYFLSRTEKAEGRIIVPRIWRRIHEFMQNFPYDPRDMTVYHDSLPRFLDEEGTRLTVNKLAPNSYSFALLKNLQDRGAKVVGPEGVLPFMFANALFSSYPITRYFPWQIIDRLQDLLTAVRDKHIAVNIAKTLTPEKVGILFIGAAHNVARYTRRNIAVSVPQALFGGVSQEILDVWLGEENFRKYLRPINGLRRQVVGTEGFEPPTSVDPP